MPTARSSAHRGASVAERRADEPGALARVFAIAALLALAGIGATALSRSSSPAELGRWALLALVAIAVAAGVAILMRPPTHALEARTSRPWIPVAVYGVIVGAAFGFTVTGMEQALGLDSGQPWWEVVASATLLTPLYALGIRALLDSNAHFRQAQALITGQLVEAEAVRVEESLLIEDLRARIRADIDTRLATTRDLIDRELARIDEAGSDVPWGDVAGALRQAAQEPVRQTSRDLWETVRAGYSTPGIGALLRDIITRQPFRPVLVAIVYALASIPSSIRLLGPAEGAVQVASVILVILLGLGAANAVMTRWPRTHAVVYVGTVVLIQVLNVLGAPGRAARTGEPVTASALMLESMTSIALLLGTSGIRSFGASRARLLGSVEEDLARGRMDLLARNRAIAGVARESARVLHGSLQTRLIACAVAIDHAADTGDLQALTSALEQARQVLADPLPVHAPRIGTTWEEAERAAALWAGLCDVVTYLHPGAEDLPPESAARIGRIIEEALTNAVRHGGATSVEIRIEPASERTVRVEVTDDGCGPTGGAPGLGSSFLDDASSGTWHLERRTDGPGARLTAYVVVADDRRQTTSAISAAPQRPTPTGAP